MSKTKRRDRRRAKEAALALTGRKVRRRKMAPSTLALGAALAAGCAVTEPTLWLDHSPMEHNVDVRYGADAGVSMGGKVWRSKNKKKAVRTTLSYFESEVEDPVADVNSRRMTAGADFVWRSGKPSGGLSPEFRVIVNGLYLTKAEIAAAQDELNALEKIYTTSLDQMIRLQKRAAEEADPKEKESLEKQLEDAKSKANSDLVAVLEVSKRLNKAEARYNNFDFKVKKAGLEKVRVPESARLRKGFRGYATFGFHYLGDRGTVDYDSTHEVHEGLNFGARLGLGVELWRAKAETGVIYPMKENSKVRFDARIGWRF